MATILVGPPGFISSPDPRTLQLAASPLPADPAAAALRCGAEIGLLGIDFATRRRNRVNGRILAVDETGIRIEVRQSFGNCPQYIQARDPQMMPPRSLASSNSAEDLNGLAQESRDLIGGADTFFVASSSGGQGGEADGVDISHRGGRPGFVRVDGNVLTIPDFRGNRYFNTLGNLLLDPRAALLFVDFATGDLLQVQGRAEIVWGGEEVRYFAGAERLWRVYVTAGWRRRAALPPDWTFRDYAPTTERTGTWGRSSAS